MKYLFMLFLLAAVIIIIAGHVGLYVSLIKFFSINLMKTKITLRIVLGIMSVSFLITSLLVYWQENIITNSLYTVASVWLGALLYAGIGMAFLWIVFLIARLFGAHLPTAVFAGVLLFLGGMYTAYGVWNAWHPVVKNITVSINGLPENWKGKKIVQLTDIHLGPVHRTSFMQKIADTVNALQPEIVLVTGDLFDGGGRDLHLLAEPLNDIMAPSGTFFITGNHETYVGVDKSLEALKNVRMQILRDQIAEVGGLQILGVEYPLPGKKRDIRPFLAQLDPKKPSIFLYHEPIFIDEAKAAGIDLQLAGHTHKGQLWPFGWITKKVYKSYDYGLHAEGNYNQYTSSGAGTWGPPIRTGNRPEIVVITLR